MKRFLVFFILLFPVHSFASAIPEKAKIYIPVLQKQIQEVWPGMPVPASAAAQVEQETCLSLSHKSCWNPRTELKTSREYGFGLGQLSVTSNFNNFKEIKKYDKQLTSWKWKDRYNPAMQLRALVVMDKNAYVRLSFARDGYERMAFTFSAYNGGLGGVMQDRRLTKTKGADPNRWFGNVENYSFKSKTKLHGYGKSFFEVNREYVRNILKMRMQKYRLEI